MAVLRNAFRRARRGLRDDLRLHLGAVASLVMAFACLGVALLSVTNLQQVADRWGQARQLTVFLAPGVQEAEIAQLRLVVESLREVAHVEHVSAEQAKRQFLEANDLGADLGALPPDAFPASLEIALRQGTPDTRITQIAERLGQFSGVEDVETYRDWFAQVGGWLHAGRTAVGLLALLVALCVLAIIGGAVRLAVTRRRGEIEVLKLCGATHAFVRVPFVLEGALQAGAAGLLAVLLLGIAHLALRAPLSAALSPLTGTQIVFLPPLAVAAMVLGATLIGALASAMSLRRHLNV